MKLFLDMTKFHLGELLSGLKLYADLMERQLKVIEEQQKQRLGKEWDNYESVFTEELPTNLRYSILVALIANVEWSLNYAVSLMKKRGISPSKTPKGVSQNALFDEKVEAAAKTLHPAVILDTSHMWIEEGFASAWVEEAHEWLAALYDFLELRVGVEMPMSP